MAAGKSVEESKSEVGQVVEGINALPAACHLAKKYKVEMPIVQAVEAILDGKLEARQRPDGADGPQSEEGVTPWRISKLHF